MSGREFGHGGWFGGHHGHGHGHGPGHGFGGGWGGHWPYFHGGHDDHHGHNPWLECPWILARMHACPWAWGEGTPGHKHCKASGKKGNVVGTMGVKRYRAEELEVKVAGKEVIIHGKHEGRPDDLGDKAKEESYQPGVIQREFTRRIPLADDIDPNTVAASLANGELTITASKKAVEGEPRVVNIQVS